MMITRLTERLERLLRDYGYVLAGDRLICRGGAFASSYVLPVRFRSELAAVEYLIPVIAQDSFYDRYRAIVNG